MPEVSVIVPVYKVEPYLRQCVDSVLTQTFTDFELILIDDGSPDKCGEICDEYAAQDVRVRVIHQQNGGLGYSRNVGMDHSSGKYLIFLDSDDYWVSSTLETLYAEAERNQTQVLAFGSMRFWDGVETPKEVNVNWRLLSAQNGIVKTGLESLTISLDTNEYSTDVWDKFYLRAYLLSTDLRFDEEIIHSDVRFGFLSYLYAERVECISARPHRYRVRPDSITIGETIQNHAHGHRVVLDGLLDTYLSHSRSEQEELLLARFCETRIAKISSLYATALKQQDWKTARFLEREFRLTLKRARALPGLPLSLRLVTYNLSLGTVAAAIGRKIRRLVSRQSRTV